MKDNTPRILVFSSLFPHPGQPAAGLFIRERMFRVGEKLPLVVIAPVPWFPMQGIIRKFKPDYRPMAPKQEIQNGFTVYHPRFFSVPGIFREYDGFFMALGSLLTLLKLRKTFQFNIIDSHFAYPDGYAASLLGQWLKVPVTITLRGTEVPHSHDRKKRKRMITALQKSSHIFSVADFLKRHVTNLGIAENKITVVGNGVDTDKFSAVERSLARKSMSLSEAAPVLISVGGLVERKGFHRVIEILPRLRKKYPGIRYLVVGGASAEGNWRKHLEGMVEDLGLEDVVSFLGIISPNDLKLPLSSADLFVLSTRNEGWANVFLEAMACGLPVITTDVGGNSEVVSKPELGMLVPFGDKDELELAISRALEKEWDREKIITYAKNNSWSSRVEKLMFEFNKIFKKNCI